MGKMIVFFMASAFIIYISRFSLQARGSHGFFRFFAWECILILFLLNVEKWFSDPLSWNQLISWFFLFTSLLPLIFGVKALHSVGKPGADRESEPHLYAFERTSSLVTSGVYRYIRHPLYSSLLWLTWGIFFKSPACPALLLSLAATALLAATARADEKECIRYFGSAYQEYMTRSKRFVPFIV